MVKKVSRFFSWRVLLTLGAGGLLTIAVVALGVYLIVVPKLPSIDSLRDIQFQVPLRDTRHFAGLIPAI